MELSFVLSALRRRFWIVTLLAGLGALPGLLTDPPVSNDFRSEAQLVILQPTQIGAPFATVDPERYLVTELAVLESAELEARVAEANGLDITEVRDAVMIQQVPETNVVEITAEFPDLVITQRIAQGFADAYIAQLDTDVADEGEIERLDAEIRVLQNRLSVLNARIQEAMEIHLSRLSRATPPPVPPVEAVDPAAVTEKNLAEAELRDLISARNTLESESRLRINTRIIQQATVPPGPIPAGGQFLLAGGIFAGFMLGLALAIAWARFSTKVLDEDSASQILGAPVVSELPHYRSLSRQPLAAFQSLPRSAVPVIDQLCVLAEAKAQIDVPLAVAVVGSQRSAGSTTLALAMAERFAAAGSSVVVVDADVRDPRITAIFNATGDGGVPSVVANDGALIDQRGRSVFTRTMDPEVSVLGLGPNRGAAALRRETVAAVLEAARRKAQIVVFDGGPALDLASTLQLTALADAVVLAVPLSRQKSDDLADLSRQLGSVRHKLLPVITSPARRAARGNIVGADGVISMPSLGAKNATPAVQPAPQEAAVPVSTGGEPMAFGSRPSGGPGVPPPPPAPPVGPES